MNSIDNFTLIEGVHIPVTNSEGFVEVDDDGRWLILDKSKHTLLALEPNNEVLNFLGLGSSKSPLQETYSETVALANDNCERNLWNREQINLLIQLCKKYESYFKSTTTKNDKVWSWISKDLGGTHTAEQSKNKFKYLKAKYVEKKDNMSSKSSGAKAVKFDVFEEFEDIFRRDPNIVPVSVACSSQGKENLTTNVNSDGGEGFDTESLEKGKKRKRSVLEKELAKYDTSLKIKEEETKKRHQQVLERQDKALDVLERMVNAFEKLVDKN